MSLQIQWFRVCPSTGGGLGSIPGWRIKIPHVMVWPKFFKNNKLKVYQVLEANFERAMLKHKQRNQSFVEMLVEERYEQMEKNFKNTIDFVEEIVLFLPRKGTKKWIF